MPGASTILSVSGLQIKFAGRQPFTAVNSISFSIEKGKTLAIVGESGSGKSLTALAIMGLLPKQAELNGDIILKTGEHDLHLTNCDLQQIRGKEVGMVFQEPMSSLNPVMSVGKQLKEAILVARKIPSKTGRQLAIEWLGKVQLPVPEQIYDRYPHQLSGGQKQRVMIAMAMCNHPALLIADEPTTALDVTVQQEIMRLMHFLQQEHGSSMLFITHDLALAATIADEVLVMHNGEIMEYGAAAHVLTQPQHPYTRALLACKPSPDKKGHRLPVVADFLDTDEVKPDIAITPGPMTAIPDQQSVREPLLAVSDLHVWFTEHKSLLGTPRTYVKAVDGVSFSINRGEILGLVGESGCGKSTLSRSLVGLIPAHDGQILFGGEDLTKLSVRDWTRVRRRIQMVFQDPYASLNPRMTVGAMLTEPMRAHNIVPDRELQKEATRLLDTVQLPASALRRYPHEFSGGQRQRIGIARALALRPELLICDESVSALDVSIQAQVLNLLKDLQHEFRLTYLFISHDLSVVHYISDRVMVMHAGKIVEAGEADQVLRRPKDVYTQKLVAASL